MQCHHHHKHQGLDPLIRSVSRFIVALSSVFSVFLLSVFLVVCSGTISRGFGLVACNVVHRNVAFRLFAKDYKTTQAQEVHVCNKLYKNIYLLRQLFVRKFKACRSFRRLLKKNIYIRFIRQNTRVHLMHSVT